MTEPHDSNPIADTGQRVTRRSWLTLLAVALGIMVIQLDGTIVSVANPSIAADLEATPAQIQWVTTGYLLVFAGLLIPAGTVADRLGHKRLFLIGVGGFTLASLLCGLSISVEMLISGRVLQAVFAAAIGPAGLALIRTAFPADALPRALGVFGAVTAAALASGPLLGGALLAVGSWNLVFLVNLPFGLLAVGVGARVLRHSPPQSRERLDLAGAATLVASMVAVIWGITAIQDNGWTTGTIGFLIGGLVLLAAFIAIESRVSRPLVPLTLFRDRTFAIGCVLSVVTMFVFFAIMFYLTFFFQGVQSKTAVATGLAMLPLTAIFTIASPLAGWTTERLGSRGTVLIGAGAITASLAILLGLDTDSSVLSLAPALLLAGAGAGFLLVPAINLVVGSAPEEKSGVASGIQQATQQLGGTLGIAVFGSIISTLVAQTFAQAVQATNAPTEVAGDLGSDGGLLESIALGFPMGAQEQLREQLGGQLAGEVTQAAHLTFLNALDTVFTVAIITVLAAALLSLFIKKPREEQQA
ncbi:drug resistance transporter, EmrB/QacA subfamily [Brevibacterium sandarakinum]|uniref:Drug resistance transporter, EmrB/QacA subfamily n=1 Tax=Brevibacterium sandarakinum TaxID=629680 RepID=A0A1H1P027_BRESA|nr:MFS transporter [Brevibacterium sandarakinum]SDS04380.1 drug resistance transporter, EmrB/QacA subfamily [Brevibacterium sandarakinum]